MTIKIGDNLPDTKLTISTQDGPKPTSSKDFFAGKKVALFAVPGAFTPTCSAKHLPSFIEKADELKAKGISEIACISVNDAFVMGAWGKDAGARGIVTMIADGNADFTKAIGLELDATGFGMGVRSQRYALIADNGVVTHLFVEAGGEYRVSSAEHMLANI